MSRNPEETSLYTEKEGQYLAFAFYYTKINGIPPAQADFQRYFSVSPPTVHQMILKLERKNLITRIPNTPRSITVSVPENQIPILK
jgi:Mn-dependent DtxR family transcriptional regulator